MNSYRKNGAIGALLDEYERALLELKESLSNVTDELMIIEIDDKDFPTIKSILAHVISAGHNYAMSIRQQQEGINLKAGSAPEDYIDALNEMFAYTERVFNDYPDMALEEKEQEKKILVSWGQYYDVEQLMEHAIVHIMRHRRQIERRLLLLKA